MNPVPRSLIRILVHFITCKFFIYRPLTIPDCTLDSDKGTLPTGYLYEY